MDLQQLPPLTALRAFAAAAQAGSVVGAADKLSVTHSAVSHQLRLIESWLGCKLFDRHAAGVTLTDAGRRLFASTARALDDIGTVCAEIRGQRPATALTLACPGSFMLQWLIPRLDDFEARHPQVVLNLQTGSDLGRLRAGHIDALVYCGRGTHPREVSEILLADNDIGPICTPAQAKTLARPRDVLSHALLGTESYPAGWTIWAQANGLDAARLRPRRSFGQWIYMIQAAIAGLGVGIAPSVLVREELAQARIAAPLGFVPSGDRISLCVLRRRAQEPAIAALADWLGTLHGQPTAG
ncbi:LysR substrate-binding domain-containing protein [Variovorax sp. CY25R-8]|uniref:LysR substrate-binding domain-containing protein n=1 Tax=Variovorax sp. CY25R-8 TaxID=2855501 RepID=UPI0021BB957E|nr:LysR substrate-binding domain-containing protein [Variovorax sp. CY25R-8]MCT8180070.1 LysR family transcriptional regulator [Variovorax sp. CY25R-8]